MSATIIDGRKSAETIKNQISVNLKTSKKELGLGTILVGNDPGSVAYVDGKHRDCSEVGISSIKVNLPTTSSEDEIIAAIEKLNKDPKCTGFIVQLPLPASIDVQNVLSRIDPNKDADGLHPINLGRLVLAGSEDITSPLPCTPAGILELLHRYDIKLKGAQVAVIGRGVTVGRPLGLLLNKRGVDATVTSLHSASEDIAGSIRQADIVVAALGVAHFVKPDWIKPGAVVLDVGITRVDKDGETTLVGDVDPLVSEVAGYLSPNPGGVGPMTRAMLVRNVVKAANR